ncbi:MAG: hypothetical protein AB1704_42855, partial [Pseudomonadota bacterium]
GWRGWHAPGQVRGTRRSPKSGGACSPGREVVSLRDGRSLARKMPRTGWIAAAVPEATTPALGRRRNQMTI